MTTGSLARRWLRPWIAPMREFAQFRHRRAPIPVDVAIGHGHVDALVRIDDGLVTAQGWCRDLASFERAVRLEIGQEQRPPTHVFRVSRPDIEGVGRSAEEFKGAIAEWVLDAHGEPRPASLLVNGRTALAFTLPAAEAVPYGHLHTHPDVLGREDIYAFGAPNHIVSEEVLHLARRLPPPVLDFGCGAGALVRALRREGVEAYGLEIDDQRIRQHLFDDVRPYVTLYDGSLPAPFPDGRFASVACSEVLEHIPGPHVALAEMARLASHAMLVTVPDMSAIPRGFAHGVVPWHLLESTHVNFFTQKSLSAGLAPHAARIEMSRLGLVQCDRMHYYSSLAALVQRAG